MKKNNQLLQISYSVAKRNGLAGIVGIKLHVDRKKLTTYSVQIKKDFTLPKYDQDSLDKRY